MVIVHDAARPLVPSELVEELVVAAEEHGAAGAIRPLVSTVLQANSDGFLDHSLDRSKHVSSETPQAFQFDILTSAYNKVCFLLLIVMVYTRGLYSYDLRARGVRVWSGFQVLG